MNEVKLLLLLIVANGAPIIAGTILGSKLQWPVDANLVLRDGHPLFGPSKTLRGLLAALIVTTLSAPLLGFTWSLGALIALSAMIGDLFSSFVKRRMGMPPSSMAPGLDQVPESVFPALACRQALALDWHSVVLVVAVFFIAELFLSRILYRFNIRRRPY